MLTHWLRSVMNRFLLLSTCPSFFLWSWSSLANSVKRFSVVVVKWDEVKDVWFWVVIDYRGFINYIVLFEILSKEFCNCPRRFKREIDSKALLLVMFIIHLLPVSLIHMWCKSQMVWNFNFLCLWKFIHHVGCCWITQRFLWVFNYLVHNRIVIWKLVSLRAQNTCCIIY